MRIAFIDAARLDYPIDALEVAPLGGTQSAMLALAEALATAGAEVCVVASRVQHGAVHRGISAVNLPRLLDGGTPLPELDAAIFVSTPPPAAVMPKLFARTPVLVHWHHNDALSPDAVRVYQAAAQGHIAQFVFCSHSQASAFIGARALPAERASVIQNAIAPAFLGLFAPGEAVLPSKDPARLVYTSAPHRGLETLVRAVFPELRRRRPGLRLEVYSGFSLEQGSGIVREGSDVSAHYQALLAECATLPGVTCDAGLPKAALAARLRGAALLCYPCTFRETASLSTLEAMAAGCRVSTTDAGALPEVTAGFAVLTRVRGGEVSVERFVDNTLRLLDEREHDPQAAEARVQRQIARVHALHAPAAVAQRWLALLAQLLAD